jgi:hypothetical protein
MITRRLCATATIAFFRLNSKHVLTTGVGWGGEKGFLKPRSTAMARRSSKPEAQRSTTLMPLRSELTPLLCTLSTHRVLSRHQKFLYQYTPAISIQEPHPTTLPFHNHDSHQISAGAFLPPRDAQRDRRCLRSPHQEEADNACSNFEAVEGEAA